ncbi:MAG: damage-inducible protein DinB [Acidobacteria bacterium]|nr:damage-inducible protein DinB [Acidobacteriota bacterium]MBV9477459.1 damage-inducible protein DinB [Acidobacteriota bacterium]
MHALGSLRDLLTHMEWADATVWNAVRAHGGGDDKLLDRLRHIHSVQWSFLTIWLERPLDRKDLFAERNLTELEAWARAFYAELHAFVGSIDDAALARSVSLPWAARLIDSPAEVSLDETLMQVAMHSIYHRGQVNTRLREIGGEPPLVDYIAWLWYRRPAPPWPA